MSAESAHTSPERSGPEQRAARAVLEEATDRLLHDLAAGDPLRLDTFLNVVAAFPGFSLYNHLLLFQQRPDARLLGTAEAWRDDGYTIRRGERALRILDRKQVIAVFDIGQTRARKRASQFPQFPGAMESRQDLRGDGDVYALYEQVSAQVLGLGIFAPEDLIVVQPDSDPEAIIGEIEYALRGYADAVLHGTLPTRIDDTRIAECHVEAVVSVVMRHLGLVGVYRANELERWGRTPRALREELELVRRVSDAILADLAIPLTPIGETVEGRSITHLHYSLE